MMPTLDPRVTQCPSWCDGTHEYGDGVTEDMIHSTSITGPDGARRMTVELVSEPDMASGRDAYKNHVVVFGDDIVGEWDITTAEGARFLGEAFIRFADAMDEQA